MKQPLKQTISRQGQKLHHPRSPRLARSIYGLFFVLLIAASSYDFAVHIAKAQPRPNDTLLHRISTNIRQQLQTTQQSIVTLEKDQAAANITVVDEEDINQSIATIKLEIETQDYRRARQQLHDVQDQVTEWKADLARSKDKNKAHDLAIALSPSPTPKPIFTLQVPILIYHKTPADFDAQLAALVKKGYHTITIGELAQALRTKTHLSGKPVVITFDDGFEDQLRAFAILQKYQMKAVYYIISGGEASHWCIGVDRHNDSCGDSYLTWNEIKTLDASGLIEIGGHTVDHLPLAGLSATLQQFEIAQNKQTIETHLGHSISAFAYPLGSFNGSAVSIVRKAGYSSAVSTIGGFAQTPDILYSLHRVRTTFNLP